jgi:hypothetical protein
MPDHTQVNRKSLAEAAPATGTPETAVHEPVEIEDDDWLQDETEQLPSRPRRRLLAPLPVALLITLMTVCGFIAGVLVEKDQGGSSSSSGLASGLAARLAGVRRTGAGAGSAFGGASGTGGGGAIVGQVTFIQGGTLYVTDAQGNTVKVRTSQASSVTKSVKSTVAGIHPGETVAVTGVPGTNGEISAESIRVGEAFGGGLAALLGGSRSGASGGLGAASRSGGGGGGGGEPALFGKDGG